MTTLSRDQSALVLIDVQVDVVRGAYQRNERLAAMARAMSRARSAGVPVIWVQHSDPWLEIGSEGWQVVSELTPNADEPRVHKTFRSSFEETDLEEILGKLDVGHLYVAGAESNNCVRHTSHAALERGYDLTLLADAHTTSSFDWEGHRVEAAAIVSELNANFHEYHLPGRSARAIPVSELAW